MNILYMPVSELLWKLLAKTLARPFIAKRIIAYAKKRPYHNILQKGTHALYMERYWLLNPIDRETQKPRYSWLPFSIRMNVIHLPDDDRHTHNHPWNARTILLQGSYTEARLVEGALRDRIIARCLEPIDYVLKNVDEIEATVHITRKAGGTATIGANTFHKITAVHEPVVTLFITGKYQHSWGFRVRERFVPWRDYTDPDFCEASPENFHEFEARAADGGCMSMSQPVIWVCAHCGVRDYDSL